jgi:hypothetical protein
MILRMEYGSPTPTRNVKPGWMVSWRLMPTHSTWVWFQDRNCKM